MRAIKLVQKLMEILEINPDAKVYLYGEKKDAVDFSGFSSDDYNEVTLYEVGGDKPA